MRLMSGMGPLLGAGSTAPAAVAAGGAGGTPGEVQPKIAAKKPKKDKNEQQVIGSKIAQCATKLSEIMAWEAKAKDSEL